MRSVSGAVVEQNPDAFKVLTPKATVGIRGTDFLTKLNPDGSEVHAVISIDQGHSLVITTHSGLQVSFSAADLGIVINPEGLIQQRFNLKEPNELDTVIKSIIKTLNPNLDMSDLMQEKTSAIVLLQLAVEQALDSNDGDTSLGTHKPNSVITDTDEDRDDDDIALSENNNDKDDDDDEDDSTDDDSSDGNGSGLNSGSNSNDDDDTGLNSGSGSGSNPNTRPGVTTSPGNPTQPPLDNTGDDDDDDDDNSQNNPSITQEYTTPQNGQTITTASGNDELTFKNTVTNTTINTNTGNDKITFEMAVTNSTVNVGDGENQITAEQGFNGNIIGGSAKDQITITGNFSGSISIGDGENQVSIDNSSVNAITGSITSGIDKDQIEIQGNVGTNTTIDAGGGDNQINFEGNLGTDSSTSVITDSGHDEITVKGELWGNITTGSGNDTVKADGTLKATSEINVGAGEDSIEIKDIIGQGATIDLGSDTDQDAVNVNFGARGDRESLTINNVEANDVLTFENFEDQTDSITINGTIYTQQSEITNATQAGGTLVGVTITFA